MPRVSILLTCYNHLAFLPVAVQSIRDQSFCDYEIIALDDGSMDGTREWLTQNLSDAKLIFNEANQGTYETLNIGFRNSSGECIAILNDDDVWHPNKLQLQLALLDESPSVGLVHTNGRFIDGKGQVTEGSPLGFEFPRTRTGNIALDLTYANKIIASSVLFRRKCLDQVGLFDASLFGSGDWDMWFRIAQHWEIGYVDEECTDYRVHGSNASHKLDRIWRDDEVIRHRISEYLGSLPDSDAVNQAKAHNAACLGTVATLNGDASAGRRHYLESLRWNRTRLRTYLRLAATFLPRSWFRRLL